MPTLAPPPPVPPPPVKPPAVPFVGRSLAEYTQLFALDLIALRGRDVLDVAAGPSSFVAEACARRIDAVAVDPLYGRPTSDLAARMAADEGRTRARPRWCQVGARVPTGPGLSRTPSPARLGTPPSRDATVGAAAAPTSLRAAAAAADRRAAAQRFLDDYEQHRLHGRYVGGALPRLPFFDATFDVVLCAHLLFTPALRHDADWHLAACRELVRVSAGDVRIHPVGGPDGRLHPGLARLRRELRGVEIGSELLTVAGQSPRGRSALLVLRRSPS